MFLLLWSLFGMALGVSTSWKPIIPAQHSTSILHQEAAAYGEPSHSIYNIDDIPLSQFLTHQDQDTCALYKTIFNQKLYFEYIHYKFNMPELKEFTLCTWTKFTNHTNDHPLFSYAVDDQPRAILAWIANSPRSSYYMMNIDGHNLYRLNYPLRLNKWYHSCQSWNGRSGEWQIWVNGERVGRGFNNRLVGHVIPGGGIAISGQEQTQLGGGFLEGEGAPPGSGGMLGELTMVQLYNVALTAGKAHRDHKHHHAHHYEHDTSNNSPRTTTQAPVTGPPLPAHPFLTGGQINHQVKLNPGANLQIVKNGVILRHPSLPPPSVPMILPPVNPSTPLPIPPPSTSFKSSYGTTQFFPKRFPSVFTFSTPKNPIDDYSFSTPKAPIDHYNSFVDSQYHNLFKRDKISSKRSSDEGSDDVLKIEQFESKKEISKREVGDGKVSFIEREESAEDKKAVVKRDSEKKKRGILQLSDGSVIDDGFLTPQTLSNDYFSGLASFGIQQPEHSTKDEEREPAEAEVKMVMNVCDGCTPDPFEKALVMDWRSVPKKLYSGALWVPAVQACKAF
ncbi:uncharacterized protein b6 [Chelonus insularis]|uniref:uncharacterized protein b6 n=1 Tax=Chelonus insularis TaxID=460826 RepID=UPI00158CA94B|nr:uncharacterized protein LOC118066352 [Chelonus insularis]